METCGEEFSRVAIDQDGDLLIRITSRDAHVQSKEFLVYSDAVGEASEKWGDLVSKAEQGGSAESRYTMLALEGNCASYEILFFIMHGKSEYVPQDIYPEEFHDLLEITGEYQATSLLRSWVPAWIKDHQVVPDCVPAIYDSLFLNSNLQRQFWISWMLGDKQTFRKLIQFCILKTPINDEVSIFEDGTGFLDFPKIPGLLDYVKKERRGKAQELRGVFEKAIENKDFPHDLDDPSDLDDCECGHHKLNGQYCRLCRSSDEEKFMCHSMILGSMVHGYRQQVLPLNNKLRHTVQDVYNRLRGIQVFSYPETATCMSHSGHTHDFCNPKDGIHRELDRIFSRVAEVLDPKHEQHLSRQAKLTGL